MTSRRPGSSRAFIPRTIAKRGVCPSCGKRGLCNTKLLGAYPGGHPHLGRECRYCFHVESQKVES